MTNPYFRIARRGKMEVLEFLKGNLIRGILTLRDGSPRPQDSVLNVLSSVAPLISPRQVHEANVVSDLCDFDSRPYGDGVLLTSENCIGTIQVADCFPLLLAGDDPYPWRLLLHSGFRGTVKNIVLQGWRRLIEHMDVDPEKTCAWIGPGIGPCCYNRKLDDPWTEMAISSLDADLWRRDDDFVWFDMETSILRQLEYLGIPVKNIASSGECTFCRSDRYLSFRSGDEYGRMVLFSSINDATFRVYL